MTIKFIDSDKVLRNILCLNKDMHEIMMSDVLKQSLIRIQNFENLQSKRMQLWLKILQVDPKYIKGEFQLYH